MIKSIIITLLFAFGRISAAQNVSVIYINAIEPCTIYFQYSPTFGTQILANCTYFLPGANLTYSDWLTCTQLCCPGLIMPNTSTIDDIQSCVNQYSTQPFMVTLTGILLGLFLCIIFIIVPCCCSKDGAYFQIKKAIMQRFAEQEIQQQFRAEINRSKQNNRTKEQELKMFNNQPGSLYILQQYNNRINITDEIIDDSPSEERKCFICKKGKANLRLNCLHSFHNGCLAKKAKEIKRCEECLTEKIYPISAFCQICERRCSELQNVSLQNTYICRVCEQK